jgi:sterol 3beta-glucosyltransferase
MLWMASKGSVKSFLKKKNGNLPKSFGAPYEKHNDKNHPALVSCSNHVFNRPKDWNENVHQYGYWFLDPKDDYVPDQELLDFINDGEKPIYIGFGSMSMMKRHKNLENLVFEAIKKSGKRAIVRGFGDLGRRDDSTFVVGNVPHTWLFSKVSGVCHHGGAGTTAAGFKAGVPSLIIPFSNDQFAWAHRAFDIGVGVSPIYVDKLTVESFAKSLCDLDDEILIENSKKLAENIKDENGLKNSVDVILELLGECNE